MEDDSIESTLRKCDVIRKSAGSVSVSLHNIRSTNGVVPKLDVDQGGGKRNGKS